MENIELVIKIPKKWLNDMKREEFIHVDELCEAILHGTKIPKGHGRLIDAEYLKNVSLLHNFHGNNKNIVPYADRRGYRLRQREVDEAIINAPTIIEADKSEGSDK